MPRAALTLAAALAVLAGFASTSQAADVTVNFSRGGGSKTVALSSLKDRFDVSQEYALVAASGQTTSKQIDGISLRALLAAVGADPTYSAVTVFRPGGGIVRMSRVQIESSGQTPVVYESGGLATFVRPTYAADDQNAADVISAAPLVITQVDGADYGLKAKVSKSSAKAGETLKFSATAAGAAGQKLEFSWNFNDGASASGENVSHLFKKRGYYRVLVSVRGEGEKSSQSTVVTVQVGQAKKSSKKREGGGDNESAGAPVSGQADGSDGSGEAAGRQTPSKSPRERKNEPSASAADIVTGQLLTGAQPLQPADLSARSGQKIEKSSDPAGVPAEAAGAAVALGLLGLGAALELGAAGRLRRRLTG